MLYISFNINNWSLYILTTLVMYGALKRYFTLFDYLWWRDDKSNIKISCPEKLTFFFQSEKSIFMIMTLIIQLSTHKLFQLIYTDLQYMTCLFYLSLKQLLSFLFRLIPIILFSAKFSKLTLHPQSSRYF